MLRLPQFEVAEPASVDEAVQILKAHEGRARPMAGGTDLMPNMKHEIVVPEVVVGLWRIPGLKGVRIEEGAMHIGALTTLDELAQHPDVQAYLPALAEAVGMVAGPQLRRMGTIGGNVCLDTRCVYINQTHFWREALGYCIKKDGEVCHVTKVGKKCVAAASNDTAPVLWTLGASVRLASPRGVRELSLEDFYVNDGEKNTVLEADEILTHIRVPKPAPTRRMGYQKLRVRDSIDFPMLSLALAFDLVDGAIHDLDIVVSAVAARPRRIKRLPGGELTDALIAEAADAAFKQVRPLTNINGDVTWRRDMVPVLLRRAFAEALGEEAAA